MHFNENLTREAKRKTDGTKYVQVTYPKFKLGESVVRDVACAPTYGNCMKHFQSNKLCHQVNSFDNNIS